LAKELFSRVLGIQKIVKLKGESFQRNSNSGLAEGGGEMGAIAKAFPGDEDFARRERNLRA
jgi:hypothetical protein